jgi:hypothetical protein
VDDANVISAFWSGTTYRTLVHELSHDWPNTTKGLFDIATRHVSGEEGVGAVFVLGDGKMVHSRSRVAPSKATCKGARKGDKGGKQKWKKGQNWCHQRVTVTYGCGDDEKEANGPDEEYVVAVEYDFKHQVR